MSYCTNESLEFAILWDKYNPTNKEINELAEELWDLKRENEIKEFENEI